MLTLCFAGIRESELYYLKGRKYLDAMCVFFWATTPVIIALLTFTCYSFLGGHLNAARVLSCFFENIKFLIMVLYNFFSFALLCSE